jgi:hypothetical protein
MKYALLASTCLALSGLALGQDSPPEKTDQLRQLQRDLPLIEFFVKEGVRLSGEENALKRARTCSAVAEKLVREINVAATQRDQQRTDNLGNFLNAVLIRGVANNLDIVRSRADDGEIGLEVQRVRDEVLRVTEPVTGTGTQTSQQQIMQPAAAAVSKGRAAVENAVNPRK